MPAPPAPSPDAVETIYVTHGARIFPLRIPARSRWVATAVFRDGEYALLPVPGWEPACVVDVGANVGAFSVYAKAHWPDTRLVAFEPVAASFELLRRNLAGLGPAELVQAALLDRDATLPIHAGRNNPGEASLVRGAEQGEPLGEVEVRRAARALESLGIDRIGVLKIDTEGSELPILRDLEPWLTRTDFVLVEYHLDDDRRAIDALLGDAFWLYGGRAVRIHRGVVRYVRRDLVRSHPAHAAWLEAEQAKAPGG